MGHVPLFKKRKGRKIESRKERQKKLERGKEK